MAHKGVTSKMDLYILSRPQPWCTSDHALPISLLIKCLSSLSKAAEVRGKVFLQFQEHQFAPLVFKCSWQIRGPLNLSGIEETSWILPSKILEESPMKEKYLDIIKLKGISEIKETTATWKHLTFTLWSPLLCFSNNNPGTLSYLVLNVFFPTTNDYKCQMKKCTSFPFAIVCVWKHVWRLAWGWEQFIMDNQESLIFVIILIHLLKRASTF